jgi:hypothetical protein
VVVALILFVGSVILVGLSHNASNALRRLDFVTLYTYKKAIPSRDKALRNLTLANKASTFWLSDRTDAAHCFDMSTFAYPVASFTPGLDPTSPTCQISFGVATTGTVGQVAITAVYTGNVASCAPGTYPLQINSGSGVVATVPNLIIAATPLVSANGTAQLAFNLSIAGSFGYNYATYNAGWTACRDARRELANQYLTNTSCETEASPMCTCIRGFTDNLLNWNKKLRYEPTPGVFLEDVLLTGVQRCMDLRRAHDIPVPIEQAYARSRPLLVFSVALLLNALYFALVERLRDWQGVAEWITQGGFLFVFFVAMLFACLFDADGVGAGEWRTMLAMLLPAFVVHGLYDTIVHGLLESAVRGGGKTYPLGPAPFLHPVVFDLCLGALTLFTLVERGIVQSEYLIVELLKVHAIAALYMGVTWYHRHVGAPGEATKAIYSSGYVQQAYLLLWLVALAAAFDTSLVPYPAKKEWELHWILPLAFTAWAFANPAWFHSLPLSTTLGGGRVTISHYNDLAGLVVFLFGVILWGYALRTHLQVFGAKNYAYPSLDDLNLPLSTKFH